MRGIEDAEPATASGEMETNNPSALTSAVEPESSDPSDGNYSPTEDAGEDAGAATEQFVEDWVLSLNRDDTISLALFLTFHLSHLLNFPSTRAAEYAAIMIGKSDHTVCQWRADFHENQVILDSQQGRYQRSGVLWSSEALNTKATRHVMENANVKGRALTSQLTLSIAG